MNSHQGLLNTRPAEPTAEAARRAKFVDPATMFAASVVALRVAIALVFVWFGALKIAGVSPVDDLVLGTTPWQDPAWFVPALGSFELALGIFLAAGVVPRLVAVVFVAHMAGTGSVLVFKPALAFQSNNPLLLTAVGEFVVKNAVLLTAGIVVVLWEINCGESSSTEEPTSHRAPSLER